MERINIKVHLPWYARGTPVINPRDGPQMALSEKTLFAICEGPSARGNPTDKTHLWLTLKTTFFVTKNSVFSHWYAQFRRVDMIIEMDMTCAPKPRRGVTIIANAMIGSPKTQRVDKIIEKPMNDGQKCHPLGVSVAHHDLCYNPTIPIGIENQTQRVDKIIENQ